MSVNNTQRALLANYLLGQGSSSTQGKNYVKNSIAINGTDNVTASGVGSSVAKNTTTPLTGISDFSVALGNNTTGYIEWSLDSLDRSLTNQNCQLTFDYKITSIGSVVQGQVYIGGNLSVAQTIPATPTTSTFSMNVPCGDLSGATTVRISNATGNSGASVLNIANVNYGKATNIGTVAQAVIYGSALYPTTANCNWQSTSTVFATFAPDADCPTPTVTGNALAPATKIPGITFASLPPGDYEITVRGSLRDATLDTNSCTFAISDGTNRFGQTNIYQGANVGGLMANLTTRVRYTAPQSNVTFQVFTKSDNAANTCQISINDTANEQSLEFIVKQFPLSSQQVYNQSLTPIYWSGAHANTCSWTGNSATFADFVADATCTLTERLNKNIGTVNTSGAVLPAITFTPPRLGAYKITVTGSAYHPNSTANYMFRMFDGTNELASAAGVDGDAAPAAGGGSFTLTGIYNATSLNAATIKLQAATSISGLVVQNTLGQGVALDWTILSLDQQFPAPILVGSVTSNSNGALRDEFWVGTSSNCTSTPCATQTTSGTITLSRSGTGAYQADIPSGTFSAIPSCVANTSAFSHYVGGRSLTAFNFQTVNSAGAGVDAAHITVRCIGPR